MKKLIVLFTALTITCISYAQHDMDSGSSDEIQTLMGHNNAVGGYGSISIKYTELEDRDAFVFGARAGLIMGHMMTLGLGGAGFFNDVKYDFATGQDLSLAGGYGGFFFEPIIMPKYPVHVSFPILIGAGGVAVVSVNDEDNWNDNYKSEASDAFMVIEPGIEVELNVTKFFRFCVGGYYRYTSDVDIEDPMFNVPTDILQGFSGGVTFKFGKF
ncbi:MAG TPA: hypothetical protein VHI78_05720 [Bacteroidales bacterium]|jgi:hypothetical protein|nr:hypothetical protein [Bacteroidales bacterium]